MENTTIDYSWQDYSVCSSMDMSLFFPTQGKKYGDEVANACAACPVSPECLDHALKYEEYGYWAGTTPKQRIALREDLGIEVIDISFESQKLAQQDYLKIEKTRVKIKGRGRKPRNLQEQL